MNIDKEIIEFLKLNLYKACLESFGIKKQFIELEFSNSRFEEIKFFLDCKLSTTNVDVNNLIKPLQKLDSDTFDVAYFIPANLKSIVDCNFNQEGNFQLDFENEYSIVFDFNFAPDGNLAITFKEKENSKNYAGIEIFGGAEVKLTL